MRGRNFLRVFLLMVFLLVSFLSAETKIFLGVKAYKGENTKWKKAITDTFYRYFENDVRVLIESPEVEQMIADSKFVWHRSKGLTKSVRRALIRQKIEYLVLIGVKREKGKDLFRYFIRIISVRTNKYKMVTPKPEPIRIVRKRIYKVLSVVLRSQPKPKDVLAVKEPVTTPETSVTTPETSTPATEENTTNPSESTTGETTENPDGSATGENPNSSDTTSSEETSTEENTSEENSTEENVSEGANPEESASEETNTEENTSGENTSDNSSNVTEPTEVKQGWFAEPMPASLQKSKIPGVYVHQKDNALMVFVPGGAFTTENGQEQITGFYIDKYPTTNQQFVAFLNEVQKIQDESGNLFLDLKKPSCGIVYDGESFQIKDGAESLPAVGVSWYGAKAYSVWAEKDLPGSLQWQKTWRGGNRIPDFTASETNISLVENSEPEREYPWGEDKPNHLFWRANIKSDLDGYPWLAPVYAFEGLGDSPYKCSQLFGNVWEWCQEQTCHGGGWNSNQGTGIQAHLLEPNTMNNDLGFRSIIEFASTTEEE